MTAQRVVPCAVMRGGTSKGLVFRAADLPTDRAARDALLCAAMGSPDPRQIDGMGGAHPLTSKVAVVGPSDRPDADVEYLFLQVWPDRPVVSDGQNCGNMLAAVGPFALDNGLMPVAGDVTAVRIFMRNTGTVAVAHVQTPQGRVRYDGTAHIDGVPGGHAPIPIDFLDIAGSSCGAMLPTGNAVDVVDGIRVTCIDNGMPVVCIAAEDLGITGAESPADLEADATLTAAVERIRLAAGPLMGLGDVGAATTPKMSLLAPPRHGGAISTRTFIPHRVHEAIGVLGAVSVATACLVPGSVAAAIAVGATGGGTDGGAVELDVEHPSGHFTVSLDVAADGAVRRAGLLRTARLLMRGEVLVLVPATAREEQIS
ncbi:4-oxalomesaconate tautomerase [Pseudonocardia sp. GCM10023141]|uniref:4-oxalomesaconate tautomerase n=1 Tax=Pseudonocardia sp. GCM10023141 TaxID=3252653 RepID=UPI00360F0626